MRSTTAWELGGGLATYHKEKETACYEILHVALDGFFRTAEATEKRHYTIYTMLYIFFLENDNVFNMTNAICTKSTYLQVPVSDWGE
jgi:hypothetical protein